MNERFKRLPHIQARALYLWIGFGVACTLNERGLRLLHQHNTEVVPGFGMGRIVR